jgi:hypothetical protein
LRRLIPLLVVCLVLASGATAAQARQATSSSGQSVSASCVGAVSWQNAHRMIGRYATIKGRVAGTTYASTSNGSPTFLNIGADYPNSRRVTAVIWRENRARFRRPEIRYRGRTVCIRGYVDTYGGAVSIELESPSQITVTR